MPVRSRILHVAFALFALSSAGCSPRSQVPTPNVAKPKPAPAPKPDPAVYRFDFVLTSDGSTPVTAFTLSLDEYEKGEIMVGKNVALAPPSTGASSFSGPRQDTGLKILAQFQSRGDSVILDVFTELSTVEPSMSVRKLTVKSKALVVPNKPSLIALIDEDSKRFQLTVTPSRLR